MMVGGVSLVLGLAVFFIDWLFTFYNDPALR
jgi:hypothetical protein